MAWIKGRAYPIIANAAERGNEKAQKILDMQSGDIAQESLDKAVDDFFGSFSSANEIRHYKPDMLESYQSAYEARKNGLEMDDWTKNYKGSNAKETWKKAANDYDINSVKEERAYEQAKRMFSKGEYYLSWWNYARQNNLDYKQVHDIWEKASRDEFKNVPEVTDYNGLAIRKKKNPDYGYVFDIYTSNGECRGRSTSLQNAKNYIDSISEKHPFGNQPLIG